MVVEASTNEHQGGGGGGWDGEMMAQNGVVETTRRGFQNRNGVVDWAGAERGMRIDTPEHKRRGGGGGEGEGEDPFKSRQSGKPSQQAIYTPQPQPRPPTSTSTSTTTLSALQQHVLFWDRDRDDIITPSDIYNGFRALGFNIPFSLLALLIPFFFSYPTTLGHSWIPDWRFRIWVRWIHKAKHGSDTGIYDLDGAFRPEKWEEVWRRFGRDGKGEGKGGEELRDGRGREGAGGGNGGGDGDGDADGGGKEPRREWAESGGGGGERGDRRHQSDEHEDEDHNDDNNEGLSVQDLWALIKRDRVAADIAGWTFAAMEWGTTWLLLQKGGKVRKGDLRACYDGSLFWRIEEENLRGDGWNGGFGLVEAWEFVREVVAGWWRVVMRRVVVCWFGVVSAVVGALADGWESVLLRGKSLAKVGERNGEGERILYVEYEKGKEEEESG